MALSFIFLRVRYKVINVMGVCLSVIGIVSLVLADLKGSRLQHGEKDDAIKINVITCHCVWGKEGVSNLRICHYSANLRFESATW